MKREHNSTRRTKIWIDLDNSPHVPLFVPIIRQLEAQGYSVVLTARDCFQVCGLADRFGLSYKRVGRHWGKNGILKLAGLAWRALQLLPFAVRNRPDLAVSHGSRSQLVVAFVMRVPSILIGDYEFAKAWAIIRPDWVIVPEVIPSSAVRCEPSRIRKYPGLKEDVYVPDFVPTPGIRDELGVSVSEVMVTLRPPAVEAHYFVPESQTLFEASMDFLERQRNVRIVALPRNRTQEETIRRQWGPLLKSSKLIIPDKVVDGLNLIWHSDLVISGGGTMNREAAALGVPVYSIFRGKIGAVDRYLAESGRLVLLEKAEDLDGKVRLERREMPALLDRVARPALRVLVDHIVSAAQAGKPQPEAAASVRD
jgi:predicted glycosyltransferase